MNILISVEQLKQWIERTEKNTDQRLVIFDVRFSLQNEQYGYQAYQAGHIPGSMYLDLNRDLSSMAQIDGGRHPLPEFENLRNSLENAGVNQNARIVIYDDGFNVYAGRLWWLLRYIGLEQVYVLNGGIKSWQTEGHTLSHIEHLPERGTLTLNIQPEKQISQQELKEINHNKTKVLDARSAKRYRGESEPIDPKAGHIPGALNCPYQNVYLETGILKPIDILKQEFGRLGLQQDDEIIVYCGSGVSANALSIALVESGFAEPRLYVGSWSEWSSNPTNPVRQSLKTL